MTQKTWMARGRALFVISGLYLTALLISGHAAAGELIAKDAGFAMGTTVTQKIKPKDAGKSNKRLASVYPFLSDI